jgi:F0F1-type ATP synthase delta subunit
MAHDAIKLPLSVYGPSELGRLKRSLESYSSEYHQATLRAKTEKHVTAPRAPRVLQEFAVLNELDLGKLKDRESLLNMINDLAASAPTVTVSFAVDPSSAFMNKLVEWFRVQIHPTVLIRIGLQPSIAAGCTVRTPSKVYDFSLRNKFTEQRELLIRRLRESSQKTVQAPVIEAMNE